jgi:ABC-2 type transport system permease protein
LTNVYMSIYLLTDEATRVTTGDEARSVLDALPDIPIPVHAQLPPQKPGLPTHRLYAAGFGFLDTIARSMPQLGLLMILVIVPLQLLSGGATPYESMPQIVQTLMLAAPTTHFVSFAQAILYRGAGFDVVWPSFLAIIVIGAAFFLSALALFRSSLESAR